MPTAFDHDAWIVAHRMRPIVKAKPWNALKHKRYPAGHPKAGQFMATPDLKQMAMAAGQMAAARQQRTAIPPQLKLPRRIGDPTAPPAARIRSQAPVLPPPGAPKRYSQEQADEYAGAQNRGKMMADFHSTSAKIARKLAAEGKLTNQWGHSTRPKDKDAPSSHEVRAAMKAKVANDLALAMVNENDPRVIDVLKGQRNSWALSAERATNTDFEDVDWDDPAVARKELVKRARKWASELNSDWAGSSQSAGSLAVQARVAAFHGLPVNKQVASSMDNHETQKLLESHTPVIDAYVRATYRNTQAHLRSLGIGPDDPVTVHRGFKLQAKGPNASEEERRLMAAAADIESDREHNKVVADLKLGRVKGTPQTEISSELILNPLTSWAISPGISWGFSVSSSNLSGTGLQGLIATATVPSRMIHSTSLTGAGCLNEYEVLLVGADANARRTDGKPMKGRINRFVSSEDRRRYELAQKKEKQAEIVDALRGQPLEKWHPDGVEMGLAIKGLTTREGDKVTTYSWNEQGFPQRRTYKIRGLGEETAAELVDVEDNPKNIPLTPEASKAYGSLLARAFKGEFIPEPRMPSRVRGGAYALRANTMDEVHLKQRLALGVESFPDGPMVAHWMPQDDPEVASLARQKLDGKLSVSLRSEKHYGDMASANPEDARWINDAFDATATSDGLTFEMTHMGKFGEVMRATYEYESDVLHFVGGKNIDVDTLERDYGLSDDFADGLRLASGKFKNAAGTEFPWSHPPDRIYRADKILELAATSEGIPDGLRHAFREGNAVLASHPTVRAMFKDEPDSQTSTTKARQALGMWGDGEIKALLESKGLMPKVKPAPTFDSQPEVPYPPTMPAMPKPKPKPKKHELGAVLPYKKPGEDQYLDFGLADFQPEGKKLEGLSTWNEYGGLIGAWDGVGKPKSHLYVAEMQSGFDEPGFWSKYGESGLLEGDMTREQKAAYKSLQADAKEATNNNPKDPEPLWAPVLPSKVINSRYVVYLSQQNDTASLKQVRHWIEMGDAILDDHPLVNHATKAGEKVWPGLARQALGMELIPAPKVPDVPPIPPGLLSSLSTPPAPPAPKEPPWGASSKEWEDFFDASTTPPPPPPPPIPKSWKPGQSLAAQLLDLDSPIPNYKPKNNGQILDEYVKLAAKGVIGTTTAGVAPMPPKASAKTPVKLYEDHPSGASPALVQSFIDGGWLYDGWKWHLPSIKKARLTPRELAALPVVSKSMGPLRLNLDEDPENADWAKRTDDVNLPELDLTDEQLDSLLDDDPVDVAHSDWTRRNRLRPLPGTRRR